MTCDANCRCAVCSSTHSLRSSISRNSNCSDRDELRSQSSSAIRHAMLRTGQEINRRDHETANQAYRAAAGNSNAMAAIHRNRQINQQLRSTNLERGHELDRRQESIPDTMSPQTGLTHVRERRIILGGRNGNLNTTASRILNEYEQDSS